MEIIILCFVVQGFLWLVALTIVAATNAVNIWDGIKHRIGCALSNKKGEIKMLPQSLVVKINKLLEEKTGIRLPKVKSIEEYLTSMPKEERAKLVPIMIPIFMDVLKEAEGMDTDAVLHLREFLLEESLGLTELDVVIETSATKLDKSLEGVKKIKEIIDEYKDQIGGEFTDVVKFLQAASLFRITKEAIKDIDMPSDLIPQEVTGLLAIAAGNQNDDPIIGEIVEEGE